MSRKDLPSVSESLPREIKHPLKRAIEEIQALTGMRGDPLDRALTWRDLVNQGLAKLRGGASGGSSGSSPGTITIPGSADDEPDLTPPPTVTGLGAVSAFAHVIVEWDAALYTQGHGHGQTNIYVAKRMPADPPAVFTDAQRVYDATGALTIAALPAELGVRWHIWAKWQTADGVESLEPAGGTNGIEVTVGKIGNADLGPLIVEAANLAEGAVDLGSDKVTGTITDPVRFGALAVGYTVTQYLLTTFGVMQNLVVDDAQVANLSAAKLTVGDGTVGGILKSTNWVAGVSGWYLRPSDGYIEASNIVARGTIYASAGVIGGFTIGASDIRSANYVPGTSGLRLNGPDGYAELADAWIRGQIIGGSFTGYAWPAAGLSGFYLGPSGLLLGNANDGKYFQVEAGGNVFSPQFTIVNGVATFSGNLSAAGGTFAGNLSAAGGTFAGDLSAATGTFSGTLTAAAVDAVNTINIAGETIVVPRFASSAGVTLSSASEVDLVTTAPLTMAVGGTGPVLIRVTCEYRDAADIGGSGGVEPVTMRVKRNGATISTLTTKLDMQSGIFVTDISDSPGAGTWTYKLTAQRSGIGSPVIGYNTILVMGAKR